MRHELTTASSSGMPSSSRRCVNSTMRMLFDTTMPTIISDAHQRLDVERRAGDVERDQHAGEPGRHGEQNQQRIGERAELRDQNQVEQHQREDQPERRSSGTTPPCPAPCRAVATRTPVGSLVAREHAADAGRQPAEILARRVDVDVDDALDLVVIDLGRRLERRDPASPRRASSAPSSRPECSGMLAQVGRS